MHARYTGEGGGSIDRLRHLLVSLFCSSLCCAHRVIFVRNILIDNVSKDSVFFVIHKIFRDIFPSPVYFVFKLCKPTFGLRHPVGDKESREINSGVTQQRNGVLRELVGSSHAIYLPTNDHIPSIYLRLHPNLPSLVRTI